MRKWAARDLLDMNIREIITDIIALNEKHQNNVHEDSIHCQINENSEDSGDC